MRVLLISEGSSEGHPAPERPQALQAIVRRVLPTPVSYEWRSVRDLPPGNPLKGKGGGHLKPALKAMWYAERKNFNGVVLVTDADRKHTRARIEQFNDAQASTRFAIPRALGLPVEEFDAWLLADQQALSQVLGKSVPMQPDPESIREPKEFCQELMNKYGWGGKKSEFYEAVCECFDLEIVANRCTKGFAPFLERLRALRERLSK